MATYHHRPIAELAHQLKMSPMRLRLRQLDAVEWLVDLIEPDLSYPYEFICHRITGYNPKQLSAHKPMVGKSLIPDLVQLIEELTSAHTLPVGALRTASWSTEALATRLNVSTKTICRWRRRGLPGRKMRYPDGTVRMTFLERSVRRFVTKHIDMVKRAAAFKQLSRKEKNRVIERAREILGDRRVRLHELSQQIASEMGRAVETVRYTLRRHDQANPDVALFGNDEQPVVRPELQVVYDAVQAGEPIEAVAAKHNRSVASVQTVVREVRARLLKATEIDFIDNDEFHQGTAEDVILDPSLDLTPRADKPVRPPKDLPPYLQDLYRQPLLDAEQERAIFRKYNYLKFKARRLRDELDVLEAADEQMDRFDALLADIEQTKNAILRANLRLVVSIARRHVGRSPHFFEIVSDGNLALMRAAEKFDYGRGFKFSTYASWAIMRNYARTVPEQMYQSTKMVTGVDEMLHAEPDAAQDDARDSILEGAKHLVAKGLSLLTARERDIVVRHYGLDNNGEGMTLDEIGRIFGVTKERVRQIERRALGKIRATLAPAHAEFVEE